MATCQIMSVAVESTLNASPEHWGGGVKVVVRAKSYPVCVGVLDVLVMLWLELDEELVVDDLVEDEVDLADESELPEGSIGMVDKSRSARVALGRR